MATDDSFLDPFVARAWHLIDQMTPEIPERLTRTQVGQLVILSGALMTAGVLEATAHLDEVERREAAAALTKFAERLINKADGAA